MFELNNREIIRLMAEQQMTISTLSEAAGLTKKMITRYLHGSAKANVKTAGKLAAALGVEVLQLLKE